ncbi:MAG: lysophospholipid acyltransferase family protein [Patescibacteria group bacterium]
MVTLIFLAPSHIAIYILRVIVYFIIFLIFEVGNKVKIIGKENLPKGTRILFLSNHETLIDSFLIALGTLTIKDVLFHQNQMAYNVPEIKNFYYNKFVEIFFTTLKTVPISRSGSSRTKIEAQVDQFVSLLENDNLVIFFEGTRSRDGEIHECKVGPALTIIKAQPLFVVPILLDGIQSIMPIKYGSKINPHINLGHTGKMIIGKPLNLERFYQEDYSWETAILQSAELRKIIKQAVQDLKKPPE